MKLFGPPAPVPHTLDWKVCLAGSIEMGAAVNWQDRVVDALMKVENLAIFNPRRPDWDASWVQSIENQKFREQVEWELKALEEADLIAMHFEPETKSPITLLELGLYARDHRQMVVHCPEGYWRKGNVDIVCKRYNVKMVKTMDGMIEEIVRVTKHFA